MYTINDSLACAVDCIVSTACLFYRNYRMFHTAFWSTWSTRAVLYVLKDVVCERPDMLWVVLVARKAYQCLAKWRSGDYVLQQCFHNLYA
mmetsp:Transcript_48113/g.119175  ORF Transcript_48113/g.119175 Transcript_48113/m.119175 type:complete len:90 (+) Transcript_48113:1729-1998(+)